VATDPVPVYLKGGPCGGTTRNLTPAEADTGELVCKKSIYRNPETGAHHGGAIVFDYAGDAPTAGGTLSTPHTHKGWQDMRHSINVNLPKALRHSQHTTSAALRALGRARKVRH
jgi:hypothetical protein